MLNQPRGIYVTSSFDLYVSDWDNDRVQWFQAGHINATTVAGNGSNHTVALTCPIGITLDADGTLFIVSFYEHRVIALGPGGVRCVVGCNNSMGSAANQLSNPWSLVLDIQGNLFVGDLGNTRIQKFEILFNQCGSVF